MLQRNLIILVLSQLISATGSLVIITLAGIIGAGLARTPALATLPVSVMIVATALTTVPATLLMRRFGRRLGFSGASLTAMVAALTAALALAGSSFMLFLLAAMLFGVNMAFTQQYRYAAAESVEPERVPRAVSFVLLGSIGGAFIGPEIASRGQHLVAGVPYAGSLLALAALYAVQATLLATLEGQGRTAAGSEPTAGRKLREIARQPVFVAAVLAGTAGYGVMSLIMTATPLSMHVNDGFTVEQTAGVIRAHVLGMYAPSLVAGFLIERLGVVRMMVIGAVTLVTTSVIGLQGHGMLHYWWALVLLGVGWNFLYVGGTTMLTHTYSLQERFRAQGVNEFAVFGTAATASLLAGTVMHYFGWETLMLIPLPILAVVGGVLFAVRRDPLLHRPKAGVRIEDTV